MKHNDYLLFVAKLNNFHCTLQAVVLIHVKNESKREAASEKQPLLYLIESP